MLAVSPLRDAIKDESQGENMAAGFGAGEGFLDFGDANLLDSIDFDDLFIGISDGDVLPDLEMDPEMLAEFSVSSGDEYSDLNTAVSEEKPAQPTDSGSGLGSSSPSGEEIVSKREKAPSPSQTPAATAKEGGDRGARKASTTTTTQLKNSQGKRKVKVDWTPELHRRFVQAVEQLGVDKAVPSRILEIMGIDCLTRHNIASHLQKYRSHRKHLLAREAEAASWSQRRQIYGAAGGGKREVSPWPVAATTMGFPPMTPPPPPPPHHFRPLHVWGHPTVDQTLMHVWPPKHLPPHSSPPPQPLWPSAQPPPDASFWHSHHQRVPNALTQGTPCFPQPLAAVPPRLIGSPAAVTIIPPVAPHPPPPITTTAAQQSASGPHSHPLLDFLPSKESIDAAIGDVLAKPWLPLPLGLKPPSTDGVMLELQRQGVPKVPPSSLP